MQPIQDKDLDNLFKQRFNALEVQPSAGSWNKITSTLDKPHKKSKSYSMWMAAASVVILSAAALLIYKPVEVIKLQGPATTRLAAQVNPQPKAEMQERQASKSETPGIPIRAAQSLSKKANPSIAKVITRDVPKKEQLWVQADSKVNTEPLFTAVNDKAQAKSEVLKSEAKAYEPVYTAQVIEKEVDDTEFEASKPRIKSVGSFVNFVIAQVDKREDKIIEFKDGEEGSEVSGINIGLLKFNNKKR